MFKILTSAARVRQDVIRCATTPPAATTVGATTDSYSTTTEKPAENSVRDAHLQRRPE